MQRTAERLRQRAAERLARGPGTPRPIRRPVAAARLEAHMAAPDRLGLDDAMMAKGERVGLARPERSRPLDQRRRWGGRRRSAPRRSTGCRPGVRPRPRRPAVRRKSREPRDIRPEAESRRPPWRGRRLLIATLFDGGPHGAAEIGAEHGSAPDGGTIRVERNADGGSAPSGALRPSPRRRMPVGDRDQDGRLGRAVLKGVERLRLGLGQRSSSIACRSRFSRSSSAAMQAS